MVTDKVMMLESCRYDNLAKYSKVFNTSEIEYHLWIYLNPEEVRNAVFLEAREVGPGVDPCQCLLGVFERESQCWIKAVTDTLNLSPGKHTYKLKMVDRFTDTDFSLYISYYVQSDNPEKPYVYVKPKVNSSKFTYYEDPEECD